MNLEPNSPGILMKCLRAERGGFEPWIFMTEQKKKKKDLNAKATELWQLVITCLNSFQSAHSTFKLERSRRLFIYVAFRIEDYGVAHI